MIIHIIGRITHIYIRIWHFYTKICIFYTKVWNFDGFWQEMCDFGGKTDVLLIVVA